MTVTTYTSRELNQNVTRAKKAARHGPVFITDRGRPEHVLLTMEEYQRLTGQAASITRKLAMPEAGDVEFEPPRITTLARPANLS